MQISTVGVIGAGTMGNGIAQVSAAAGLSVIMVDVAQAAVDRGLAAIGTSLDRLVKKEKLSAQDAAAVRARVRATTQYADLAQADLVIEAATENVEIKRRIMKQADEIIASHAVLATNTSSISITALAAGTSHPERFIGMHFFNPVPMMKLVEITRGIATSDATFATVQEVAKKLGKTVAAAEDSPGFIVNRVLCPMINEAIFALQEGTGTVSAIDTGLKLGANHPMGPLELADFVGLDTLLAVMRVLHDGLGEDKYRPCPLLVKYVNAGWLGRKSGRGFYDYTVNPPRPTY